MRIHYSITLAIVFAILMTSLTLAQSIAVDADITGNTATSLGTTDSCISANIGSNVDIDLVVKNVTKLNGFETRVIFNSAVMKITGNNINMFLSGPNDISDGLPNTTGDYHFIIFKLTTGPSGSGVLARLTFNIIGNGEGTITLTDNQLVNNLGNQIGDANDDGYFDGPITNGKILVGQLCAGTTTTVATTITTTTTTTTTTPTTTLAGQTTTTIAGTTTTVATTTTTTQPAVPLGKFTYNFTKIEPGTTSFAAVTDTSIGVKEVSVQVKNSVENVSLSITKFSGKPASVTQTSGQVYQYLQIDHPGLDDSNTNKAFIKFSVPKSWLTSNDLLSSQVSLQRYETTGWRKLVTTQTNDNGTHVEFQAESPGFSVFAVTGENPAATTTTQMTTTTAAQSSQTPTTTLASTPVTNPDQQGSPGSTSSVPDQSQTNESQSSQPDNSLTYLLMFVVLVILIIIAVFLFRRLKNSSRAEPGITSTI